MIFRGNRDFQTLNLQFPGHFSRVLQKRMFLVPEKNRQVLEFSLKEFRNNDLKNLFLDFSFWIQGYRTVQRAHCVV